MDLIGGALFSLLYDGVKQAVVKNSKCKSELGDLESTLDSIQPRIIQQIGEHNTDLGLPNDEIEDLQRQMEEGVKMVRKLSEFRFWNCFCAGDYTDQLIELNRALKRLLEMLRLQEARDVKETLLLSRQNRDKLDEVSRKLNVLMQQQQKAGDVTDAMESGNITETGPETIQGNAVQVAALDGGDALETVFGMLNDTVLEVEGKYVMFKAPLGELKSTLDSLNPVIEEIAQYNKVCVRPKEELEKFTKQMEKGVKLILECSKVHSWPSRKKSTYTEKLLGLDKFLQGQLYFLKMQVARDVRSTIVYIRDVEMAIKQIEESGVLQNQIQTKGWSAVAEPSLLTVGLDVVSVQGIRDVKKALVSVRNTENMVHRIEGNCVIQNNHSDGWCSVPEPPQPSVGLDVRLRELKMKLFNNEISMLVLTAPGGCGKTTLATKLCQDAEVKDKFKNNIFFVAVSKKPNLYQIVQELYHQIGAQVPDFKNEVTAVSWLQQFLKKTGQNSMLFVLDDVWAGSEFILEKFDELKTSNYKILVTSRSAFPRFGSPYYLDCLNYEDAMALFNHSAFLEDRSSYIPEDLPQGSSVDSESDLLVCLQSSLDASDEEKVLIRECDIDLGLFPEDQGIRATALIDLSAELYRRDEDILAMANLVELTRQGLPNLVVTRECVMDLGLFPEDQGIPATALIDMWAELYRIDEDSLAMANLFELACQGLANLVVTRKDNRDRDDCYSEHFVTQHDILRELVIQQMTQEPIQHRMRLMIDIC